MAASIGARLLFEGSARAGSAASPNPFRRCYGPSHISADLAKWLDKRDIGHVTARPATPKRRGRKESFRQNAQDHRSGEASSRVRYATSAVEQGAGASVTDPWRFRMRHSLPRPKGILQLGLKEFS